MPALERKSKAHYLRNITLQYISSRFTLSTTAPGSSFLFLCLETKSSTYNTATITSFCLTEQHTLQGCLLS